MSGTLSIVLSVIATAVSLVCLGVIIADRRWREKIAAVLQTTENLLTEQQRANKSLQTLNADLTTRMAEMKAELKTVTSRLDAVTEELRAVREDLRKMTLRAETAEDKADD